MYHTVYNFIFQKIKIALNTINIKNHEIYESLIRILWTQFLMANKFFRPKVLQIYMPNVFIS